MRRGNNSRNCGFTLVELLVVIGIIAVLVSILLPTLSKARKSANKTVCLSHVRQLATAATAYMAEHKQVFPYQSARTPAVIDPLNDTTGPGGAQTPTWVTLLWPYMGKNTRILICPTQPKAITSGTSAVTNQLAAGYVANGLLTHFGGRNLKRKSEIVSFKDDTVLENMSKIRPRWGPNSEPSITAAGWVGWMYFSSTTDVNAGPTGRITDDPHETGQNVGFLDGHGEFRRWQDLHAGDFGLEHMDNGTWSRLAYEPAVNGYTAAARLGRMAQN